MRAPRSSTPRACPQSPSCCGPPGGCSPTCSPTRSPCATSSSPPRGAEPVSLSRLARLVRRTGRVAEPAPLRPSRRRVVRPGAARERPGAPRRRRVVQRVRDRGRRRLRAGLRRRALRCAPGRLAPARRRRARHRRRDPEHGRAAAADRRSDARAAAVVALGDCARGCGLMRDGYGVAGAVARHRPGRPRGAGLPARAGRHRRGAASGDRTMTRRSPVAPLTLALVAVAGRRRDADRDRTSWPGRLSRPPAAAAR